MRRTSKFDPSGNALLDKLFLIPWMIRSRLTSRVRTYSQYLRDLVKGTEVSMGDFLRALQIQETASEPIIHHFRQRQSPRLLGEHSKKGDMLNWLSALDPECKPITIARADTVVKHTFRLLGQESADLGEDINWHTDFFSGHRFKPRYFKFIHAASYPGGYDIKVPWELSRCQHLVWLGQAYWFTQEETYAVEFADQIMHWINQNPPKYGVNWASTMDVAIRVVNWIWGYFLFLGSTSLSEDFHLAFLKSLLTHGRFIMDHLDVQKTPTGDLTNNHYLANLVGLVYLGTLFPEFEEAKTWKEFSLGALETEMFRQVYAEGFHFEASTSYHRLVLEMFLSTVILARKNGISFSTPFMQRLERMLEVLLNLIHPDGTAPLIGDQDNGRLHRLKIWEEPHREWLDYRYLLAIGAVLYQRGDFAQAAGDQWEEAIWLLGNEAIDIMKEVDPLPRSGHAPASVGFQEAGVYVLHGDDFRAVINTGRTDQTGPAGHAHNDLLSFELYGNGHTWMIDPGTFVYTSNYEERNNFRSTAYHNTLRVDRQEMNRFHPSDVFRSLDQVPVRINLWKSDEIYDLLDAEHSAYHRLEDAVTHRRQIMLDKKLGMLLLKDHILGQKEHWIESFFHLAPEAFRITTLDPLSVQIDHPNGGRLSVTPIVAEGLELEITEGWVSRGYGHRQSAPVLSYRMAARTPAILVILISSHQSHKEVGLDQLREIGTQALSDFERRLYG